MRDTLRTVTDFFSAASSPNEKKTKKSKEPEVGAMPILEGVTILVVEDDPISQKLTAVLLAGEGAEVQVAPSAEHAIAMLNKDNDTFVPDVLVVDIVLPRMSGLVFVEEHVRKDPRLANVVVIAVSAMNGPELERMAIRSGCDVYLRKPLSTDSFPATIAKALEERGP